MNWLGKTRTHRAARADLHYPPPRSETERGRRPEVAGPMTGSAWWRGACFGDTPPTILRSLRELRMVSPSLTARGGMGGAAMAGFKQ